jgi:ribosomal protein S18 acetylase RimI-like enzyme
MSEAIKLARRYHEVAPSSIQAQMMFLESEVWDGHANQTWPAYAKLRQKFPAPGAMFEAWSRAIVGQKEESLKLLRPLEQGSNAGLPLAGFARAYAFMGDEPNTVMWLERAADHHEWQVLAIAVDPVFKNMEDSPGFHRLKKRIRLE